MELRLNRITIDLSTTGAEASVHPHHEERGYVTRGIPENRHVDNPRIQAARDELISAVEEAVSASEQNADEPLVVTRALGLTDDPDANMLSASDGFVRGMEA